jgi:hypothetical protein
MAASPDMFGSWYVDGLIDLSPDPTLRPLDEVLVEVFTKYGMPRLGGASGRGWSTHAAFQRCPLLYKLRMSGTALRRTGPGNENLEIGSAFHTLAALHYTWMIQDQLKLTPEVLREELLDAKINIKVIMEAWRLYEAYSMHYNVDCLYPLAIEEWANDYEDNTCRYDLVARVDEPQAGIVPGTWIVEHKTASRFDDATLDGWRNDGEVLGQIMIWKRANLDEIYGELRGVIVNITGKQKIPQFHRTIVPVQAWHVPEHAQDLKVWSALRQMCEVTDTWPRSRVNCVSRFGKCEMFDVCAENRQAEYLVGNGQ